MDQPKTLSHLDEKGRARMVDVGNKPITRREASAEGYVLMHPDTLRAIANGSVPKGDVFAVARVAGIMAGKRCSELIPLCHGLSPEAMEIEFDAPEPEPQSPEPVRLRIRAVARINAKTGVEMEALTSVSVAALTIYDMCKAIDKQMVIEGVRLVSKSKR